MLRWLLNLFSAKPQAIRSPRWRDVREARLKEHSRCAACGTSQYLEVHHIKSVSMHPEMELSMDNLLTLCEAPSRHCHFRIGHSLLWSAINPHSVEDAALQLKRISERQMH
jgi:hypothetical protein